MAKSKQKIQIYLYKLKELLEDGLITKQAYDLIYNGRYVKEVSSDDREPCYTECMKIYYDWYAVKSGGDIPNISAIQGAKLKSIINQLRASIFNSVRNKGNVTPNAELVIMEIINVWKLILSANINELDLKYCNENGVTQYTTIRNFWDSNDKSIFYGKMTTINAIEQNLDNIKTNIRLRNEQARNSTNRTIGGIDVDKAKRALSNIPSTSDHLQ
jgi:hypothetical protein